MIKITLAVLWNQLVNSGFFVVLVFVLIVVIACLLFNEEE